LSKIDLPSKRIPDTGSSIPGSPQIYLGQDGRVLYAVNWSDTGGSSTIQIYHFDKANGVLTQGGEISQPALNAVYPAARE
jgi:hypothetical protein